MTPTLSGRIQTRLFLIFVVGVVWTILVIPVLALFSVATVGQAYAGALFTLVVVAILGCGWELAYHALQQRRWEKDWPTLYGLITMLPEMLLTAIFVLPTPIVSGGVFFFHFTSTWIVMWLWANGPMRVLSLHWRFNGGRLV